MAVALLDDHLLNYFLNNYGAIMMIINNLGYTTFFSPLEFVLLSSRSPDIYLLCPLQLINYGGLDELNFTFSISFVFN